MELLTWIMHIDMDAFFASVEQMDNPELRGKPVAVGGTSNRSVVSAASYEIRKFGVRSAMPVVQARKLCPQAIFVSGRMSRYKEISRQVMSILNDFSPLVEQASVDEAYLDATGLEGLFGPVHEMGQAIRDAVKSGTGLTCSVGVAPVRFLAKIASDLDKPDGLTVIAHHEVQSFLQTLPVEKIPGVGGRTLENLKRLGVRYAADFSRHPEDFWRLRLGKAGPVLLAKSRGVDPTGVVPHTGMKSSSAENTFRHDTRDRKVLRKWLLRQSERVGSELRKNNVRGRTVTLKVKFSDFRQITRSRTLDRRTATTDIIYRTAVELLDVLDLRCDVRLIGVGVSNFKSRARQLSLLEQQATLEDPVEVDKAIDEVRRKFGNAAVQRGELLDFK